MSILPANDNDCFESFSGWQRGGERVLLELPGQEPMSVFVRAQGTGPWLTMLHGFPTCSLDWARLVPLVCGEFRTLCFDFPGFGDSDKPKDARYDIRAQADCIEAVWRHLGVKSTYTMAHDLGATIFVETLRRHDAGELPVTLPAALMTNFADDPAVYRPLLSQKLLLHPWTGPMLSRLPNWAGWLIFRQQFGSIFTARTRPSEAQLRELWISITNRDGPRNYSQLVQYINERIRERSRWQDVCVRTRVPLRYVWGLQDRIEGRNMMESMRRRNPSIRLRALEDIGHCPNLEAPEILAEEVFALLNLGHDPRPPEH